MDVVASLKTVLSLLGDEGQGCDCQKCKAIRRVKDEIKRLEDNAGRSNPADSAGEARGKESNVC